MCGIQEGGLALVSLETGSYGLREGQRGLAAFPHWYASLGIPEAT